MARRLEWQPVAAQGLNPLGALSTSIGALQGAANTTQALRDNQRADDALIQGSYTNLINSYLSAGELEVKQQAEARKSKGEESFNPAVAERIFTNHFAAGGTPENFMDNPEVMGLINQYGESVFNHGIQTHNRFNEGIKTEIGRLTGLAETTKAARLLEIDALDADEAVKDRMRSEVENEHINTLAGIQSSALSNFTNLQQSRNRYLGLEPAEATTEGGAPRPVDRQAAKSNEFSEYMSQLHTEHTAEADRIDQEHLDGLINDAEYSRQRAELDENFNQQLRQLGKDSRRYNMTSGSGERLSFDYSDLPNGGIQVGNRTLSADIGNAFRTASDAFEVPVETLLAFANLESNFNPEAESSTGVKGIMQVTTSTGREMFNRYRNVFESHGVTSTADRNDPRVSTLTGAAYLAHIRDDILHGDAPIEQLYVAYNVGPNDPLVRQFHHRNVPIDKLPGVDVNSKPYQANKALYYDESRGAWRTPAEISAVIQERMGVSRDGEDPVSVISRRAATDGQEVVTEPVAETMLNEARANNSYHQLDLNRDPIGELSRVTELADSIRPLKTLGADGKVGVQLSSTEFGEMLNVMGVKPNPKRINELHTIVREHPVLSTMPAEEISVLMSFAPAGMWGGLDKESTMSNIENMLEMREQQSDKIRAQMTSADNLRKYASAYTETRDKLQDRISELEGSLNRFDNRQLTAREQQAREETARLLVAAQRELASATAMYQGRMQEDYENILRFRDEMMQTYINRPSDEAEEVVKKLESVSRRPEEQNRFRTDVSSVEFWRPVY